MKPKHLEWFLSDLESFTDPKLNLEQYATDSELALSILNCINAEDCIEGHAVADLGCGCGILLLGMAKLGASYGLGIDIDEDALAICQRNIEVTEFTSTVDLLQLDVSCDIRALTDTFDIVIMNPPFGTKNNEGIDLKFVEAGLSIVSVGGAVYSLHKTSTRHHILRKFSKRSDIDVECLAQLRWCLPKTYRHHKKTSVDIEVDLIRFSRFH
ncbi:hypothetical protein AB6A40_004474 [Gnathostoma spinigerum]|uniref:Methyltransferase-like protein 5 n=1 Tax=Gnathostoma spinigerum TaxID=75299 RepID=A0ABD6ECL7_9BILA